MDPNACQDYVWDQLKNAFVCQTTVGQHHWLVFLLAITQIFIVLFLVVVAVELARLTALVRAGLPVRGFNIQQVSTKGKHMAINGVKLGGTGVFSQTPTPPGAVLPPGVTPVWSSADPKVALTPSADGSTCSVVVDPSDANTNFPLTVTASAALPDGTTPSSTVNVPILAPVVTGFDIEQVS